MEFKLLSNETKDEIKELFEFTFTSSEGESEGQVIGNLASDLLTSTNDNDLQCYLATDSNQIIGCIIFTNLALDSGEKAFLLSPVAIHPNHQGKGIGQKLINYGLNEVKSRGGVLAITYGDPKFYTKVGFSQIDEDIIKAPQPLNQPEGWLGQSLVGENLQNFSTSSHCVPALDKPEYW